MNYNYANESALNLSDTKSTLLLKTVLLEDLARPCKKVIQEIMLKSRTVRSWYSGQFVSSFFCVFFYRLVKFSYRMRSAVVPYLTTLFWYIWGFHLFHMGSLKYSLIDCGCMWETLVVTLLWIKNALKMVLYRYPSRGLKHVVLYMYTEVLNMHMRLISVSVYIFH